MMYRANFTHHARQTCDSTRWYSTMKEAQDALMRHPSVGQFQYLGDVQGDASEAGQPCLYAPRNGGVVDVDVRVDGDLEE